MRMLRDVLRIIALMLVVAAVWKDSVAYAICAGTLAGGVFCDAGFTWLRLPRMRTSAEEAKPTLRVIKPDFNRQRQT